MTPREAIRAKRDEKARQEKEDQLRKVRFGEYRDRIPDIRRRNQVIEAEIEALRRQSLPVGKYMTEDEAFRLRLALNFNVRR